MSAEGFSSEKAVVTKISKLIYNPSTPDSVKRKLYAIRSKKTQTKIQLDDLINFKKDDKKNSKIKIDVNKNNNDDLPVENLLEKPSLTSRKSKTDMSLKISHDEKAKTINDGKLSKQRSKSTMSIRKHVNFRYEHEEIARKRSYDPEEARKYIRDQKLKRKSLDRNLSYEAGTTFGNKYQKNTKSGYDREEIKKRLVELHKRTQKIIERNVDIARKKNEESHDNYHNQISYNSYRRTTPLDKTKLKALEDVKFSDRNKGKISLRKSISDVTCMSSIKEDTKSIQSEKNELETESLQLRKKKVGLLRRSSDSGFSLHLDNADYFTNLSNENTPKFTLIQPRSILVSKSKPEKIKNNVSENVRILIDGELMFTQLPPSELKVVQQQQKTEQQEQQQEDGKEEQQKTIQTDTQQQKTIKYVTRQQQQNQNMLESDDLKLSVPETSLKSNKISTASLEEKSVQISSSLLQPQTKKLMATVPSEAAKKVTKIPSYLLKHTPLQIYPYNFIMAVRRKLEAITTTADGPKIQETLQKKSTQRKTSKSTLSSISNHNFVHKPEEFSPITLNSSKNIHKIVTNSTNSKYNASKFSSSSTSAAIKSSFNNINQKNIQQLKKSSNNGNGNGNIIESLKENIYSNKATKESSTSLSELLSNLSSITINIPKSGDNCGEHQTTTISEISSIKSDSVNISSKQKISQIHKNSEEISKNQDNDDTTVSSSVFSSPEKQQHNKYHQIKKINNNNDYTHEIQKDSIQEQQNQNDMKDIYDILINDNLIVPSFTLKRQNMNLDNLSEKKDKNYENENSVHLKINKNINSNNHHNSSNVITTKSNYEKAMNDSDFEQFLEDFNKNLTQVIEANEQIKTGITPRKISNENNDIENTKINVNDLYSSDFEENYETHSKSNESNMKNNSKITETSIKITPISTITTRINSNSSISSETITDNNQIKNDNDYLNSKNSQILSKTQNLKLNNFGEKQEKIIKPSLPLSSSTLNNLEDNLSHDNNNENSISEEISSLIEKNNNNNHNSSDDKILISDTIEIAIEEEISNNLLKDSNNVNDNNNDDVDKTIVQSDYWKSHINTSRGDFYINDKSNNSNEKKLQQPEEYKSIESFQLYNKNLSKFKTITNTTTTTNATTTTTIVSTIPKSRIETNYVNTAAVAAATTITNGTTTAAASTTTLNQSDDKDLSIISFLDNLSDATLNYSTIGLYEQLLKAETTKSEYLSAMLKIREKSLMDRTRGQVAWLEVQKEKCRAKGLTIEISAIKKRQRAILMKMEKEREEIQNLIKSRSQTTDKSSIRKNIMSPKLSEELLNVSFRKNLSINNINSGCGSVGGNVGGINGSTSGSGGSNNSNNSMIRGYELEGCRSLEIILKKRENELRKRREHIKKLLEWHQRLDKEEKEMNEIEKMLFNYNKIYYNQQQQNHYHNDEKKNDNNQINKKLSSSSTTTMSLLSYSEIYTKKLNHINKSLKELQNIPDYKKLNKIIKNDNDNENNLIEFKNNDYIKIMGKNLNKLWENLTGHTQDKFEKERFYKINRKNLEKIYEKAKQVVLNDFNYAQKNNLKKFLFNETITTTTTNTSAASIKLNKIDNNDREKSFEKRKSERKELKEGNSFSSLVFSNISISHSFTIDDDDNDYDDDHDDVDRNDQMINRKKQKNEVKIYQQQQQQESENDDYNSIVPMLNLDSSISSLSIQSSENLAKIQTKSQQSTINSISEAISEKNYDNDENTNTDKAIEESIQTIENNSDEIVSNENNSSDTNNTVRNSNDVTDESVPVSYDFELETNNKIVENRLEENVHSEIEEDNFNSDGDDGSSGSSSHNSIKSEILNFINKSSSTATDQEILTANKIDTDTNDSFNNLNNRIHEDNECYSENFDIITETQTKESLPVIITDSNETVTVPTTVSEKIIQNQIDTDTTLEISPIPSIESINTPNNESDSIKNILQKSNEINKELPENVLEEIYIKNNEKNETEKENVLLSELNDITLNNLNLQNNESFSPSFLTILSSSSSSIKSEILELSNLENIQNGINNADIHSYKSILNGNIKTITEDKVNNENEINEVNDNENDENFNSEEIILQKKNSQNLSNNKLNLSFDLSQINDDDTMIQNMSLPEFESTLIEDDNDDNNGTELKNFNEVENQLNENDKMIKLLEFKTSVDEIVDNKELEISNEQNNEEILTEDEYDDDEVKEKIDNSENDDDRTTSISPVSSESNELKQRLIHIGESLMELHQTFERALSPEKSVTSINLSHQDLKGQLEQQQSIASFIFHDEQLLKNSSLSSSFITENDNNHKIIEENYENENLNQHKFSLSSSISISDVNTSNTTYIPSSMNVIDTTVKVSTIATTAPTTVRNYLAYSDSNISTTSTTTTTTATVTTTSSSSTGLMPDIINEVELRRRQQILFENEQIRQLEHEVPYVFLREIPNKPPPPYVPPAHGSPMTAIFPSEQRIQEITFRRTKELYEKIINESANNKHCEKTDSILDENITNIYERIILDICKERIDELKSSILNTNNLQMNSSITSLSSPPTSSASSSSSLLTLNYKYPLALYNPPDRLKCLQIIIYKHIRKVLAMDKKLIGISSQLAITSTSSTSSTSSSLYGNNMNCINSLSLYEKNNQKTIYSKIYDLSRKKCIDHVDEILLQELNDDEQKWTNFDVEENEIKKRVINDIFNDILNEIMNQCIITHNKKKKQQYQFKF